MATSPANLPFWRAWLTRPALPAGGIALLLLALAALPMARQEESGPDPAADAAAASRALREQIAQPGLSATAPDGSAVVAPDDGRSTPGGRDLFAPAVVPRDAPCAPPGHRDPRPVPEGPALPSLGGILVTGTRRQAVVDGERVEVGDLVAGYRVAAIEVWGIEVTRGGKTYRLQLGGER